MVIFALSKVTLCTEMVKCWKTMIGNILMSEPAYNYKLEQNGVNGTLVGL